MVSRQYYQRQCKLKLNKTLSPQLQNTINFFPLICTNMLIPIGLRLEEWRLVRFLNSMSINGSQHKKSYILEGIYCSPLPPPKKSLSFRKWLPLKGEREVEIVSRKAGPVGILNSIEPNAI